jgi:hypothetical protein
MPGCRHYTKVVIALQSPIIYSRVAQIVKGEILYPGFLAWRDESFL